ncbi:hypothetical protein G7Z17_g4056 [Cylindrodendrum hubeiense]|uniref:Uncharacterized protein n=1 Tax=Cylindrodendrum hubeiense TaxID=595255 RepID=A0A9P5HEN7_9HYPO|nr:hypothetical protein G7Z17_g4056 [Cylindrodendrum hubeiense]
MLLPRLVVAFAAIALQGGANATFLRNDSDDLQWNGRHLNPRIFRFHHLDYDRSLDHGDHNIDHGDYNLDYGDHILNHSDHNLNRDRWAI